LNEALASLERASSLAPAHAGAWTQRGTLLKDMGRRSEAAAAFERAIELEPMNPTFLRDAAQIEAT
jgi:Flp pilus assembly protein TadD